MRGIKVQRNDYPFGVHRMLVILTVTFAMLFATILLYSTEIVGVTGYSVLPELYGGFAPLFLVVCVIVLVMVYRKLD